MLVSNAKMVTWAENDTAIDLLWAPTAAQKTEAMERHQGAPPTPNASLMSNVIAYTSNSPTGCYLVWWDADKEFILY